MKLLKKLFSGKSVSTKNKYNSYSDYVEHQKEKTTDPERRERWLTEQWDSKVKFFKEKFSEYSEEFFKPEFEKAVGLGARTGQEIQAFKDLGFDAIGVDLVACEPLVIVGDIHDVPFDDSSTDIVFTNVFDHSLYPNKFVGEIERILRPGGLAILHRPVGKNTDQYGVTDVPSAQGVVDLFTTSRCLLSRRMPNWAGMTWELLMEKQKSDLNPEQQA